MMQCACCNRVILPIGVMMRRADSAYLPRKIYGNEIPGIIVKFCKGEYVLENGDDKNFDATEPCPDGYGCYGDEDDRDSSQNHLRVGPRKQKSVNVGDRMMQIRVALNANHIPFKELRISESDQHNFSNVIRVRNESGMGFLYFYLDHDFDGYDGLRVSAKGPEGQDLPMKSGDGLSRKQFPHSGPMHRYANM